MVSLPVVNRSKRILLVNPWIHDFSAFDLWTVPLGLLYIASFFKSNGIDVYFLDLTDPFYSINYGISKRAPKRKFGKGHYPKQVIEKPEILSFFPRKFRRYGIPPEDAEKILREFPPPHFILLTSRMTYWYTGVKETVSFLKEFYPQSKIVLGGIYASLLPAHALSKTGVDIVLVGPFEKHIKSFEDLLDIKFSNRFPSLPYLQLYKVKDFVPVLLSKGCPFSCSYCASPFLFPDYSEYSVEEVIDYIIYHSERLNTSNIVFYDDAFLYRKEYKALPFLNALIKSGQRFNLYFPNAIHARYVDRESAELLKEGGGKGIFIGLEFSDETLQRITGGKVDRGRFEDAVENLHKAGFNQEEIGVYVMAGYPYQEWEEVMYSIDYVLKVGAYPKLVEFSPLPHTPDWKKAVEVSPFPIKEEPLFHNNSILPCRWKKFTFENFIFLKSYVHRKVSELHSR